MEGENFCRVKHKSYVLYSKDEEKGTWKRIEKQ